MASFFGGWWRLALVAASGLGAVSGCGESFVTTSGTGGEAGSGGTGAGPAGGTTTTGGGPAGGGGTGGAASCSVGDTQSCYTGDEGTLGKGVCTAGSQTCNTAGEWDPCMGDVTPAAETCDGQDNDCDDLIDDVDGEPCPCVDGDPCYPFGGTPGEGACKNGTKVCKSGELVECAGAVGPTDEICNGLDDDCDGTTDDVEGLGNSCDTGAQGVCAAGVKHCNLATGELECDQVNEDSEEICDGKDNDCDGKADDLAFQGCSVTVQTPMGQQITCNGSEVCAGGSTPVCAPGVFLADEFANFDGDWNFGLEWNIAPTMEGSAPGQGNPDPAMDHSPSNDNGVAGAVIGGNPSLISITPSYLTSKSIDTTGYGSLYLSYWRWLNTSGNPDRPHTVEVSQDNGMNWLTVWTNGPDDIFDSTWVPMTHNLSAFAGKVIRIRFGFAKKNALDASVSSWNIDDLVVSSCPPGMIVPSN